MQTAMGPLADRAPHNILDPGMDCGSFVDEKLWMQMDADPNP